MAFVLRNPLTALGDRRIVTIEKEADFVIEKNIKIMPEEVIIKPGSPNDPDNPSSVLARLGEDRNNLINKIKYIPWDRTKFVCPNHKVRMVIVMADSGIRNKANQMEEYNCICGVIYIRTKDRNKLN